MASCRAVPVKFDELDLVEDELDVAGRPLRLLRPRDPEALLDEDAFEREEFLPYWAEVWPSSLALADMVEKCVRPRMRVLELGCGLALPSIVAALAGARAAASDWSADAVDAARRNAALNGVAVEAVRCSWDDAEALVAAAPWDLVVASDVLYERRNVSLLLALLPRLVDGGEVLLSDPGRPPTAAFLEDAAAEWQIEAAPDARLPRGGVYRLRKRRTFDDERSEGPCLVHG